MFKFTFFSVAQLERTCLCELTPFSDNFDANGVRTRFFFSSGFVSAFCIDCLFNRIVREI